jgi:hypothetical protein
MMSIRNICLPPQAAVFAISATVAALLPEWVNGNFLARRNTGEAKDQ